MLAYGLFLARLNAEDGEVTLFNAREHIPRSFRLIRELVDFLTELEKDEYREIRWVVEEVLSIVNGLDLAAIREDLSFRQRKAISRDVRAADEEEHRLFERDPFIYFYEGYLKAYDPEMRKGRGVYYTPPPVVNFIIRAVDDVLKDTFGIADGLADHQRVTVLDFACGTGTFLLEVFQRIFENTGGADSGRGDLLVRDHILRNVFGFEYLIAPYTIAHLKLSQYLQDQGHPLKDDERLQILLTNTLEPVEPQTNLLLEAVSAEVEAAQRVKEQPILVITGNPPYSGHSKNKGAWISAAIEEYKFTWEKTPDGLEERKPLRERNSKWLHDDYVKFIRFAQMKMDGYSFVAIGPDGRPVEHTVPGVESGIVAVITNHSWLDNPTFRGMRQSLMRSFEQIYVLDLHGNSKKKERAPDGSKDENVFDIEQGVAISVFIKKPGIERAIWHGDLWGERLQKYRATAGGALVPSVNQSIAPKSPFYLFTFEDVAKREQYDELPSVRDIFDLSGTGIITKRDKLTIHFTRSQVWRVVNEFARTPDQELHRKFKLAADVRDWKASWAKNDLNESGPTESLIRQITYRPFDKRYTYYTGRSRGFLGWPVPRLVQHMKDGNIALLTARTNKSPQPDHFLVTTLPAETKAGESTIQSYNFCFMFLERMNCVERIFLPIFASSSMAATTITTHPRKFSVSFMPCCMHLLTGNGTRSFYASTFPAFLSPKRPRSSSACPPSVGGWCRPIWSGSSRGPASVPMPDRAATRSSGYATRRKSKASGSMPTSGSRTFLRRLGVLYRRLSGDRQIPEIPQGPHPEPGRINHIGAIADILAFTIGRMAEIDEAYGEAFPDA